MDFSIQLDSNDSGALLTYLNSKALVNSFMETIPSANEIFIRTVQSKGVFHE
jgi:ABC-2 type transport system ATP-binding protein